VEFTHIPGTTNTAADALSRLSCFIQLNPLEMADPNETWMSDYLQQDHPINGFKPWEDWETPQNNIFYHHGKYWVDDRIMVPDTRITEVISGSHDAVTAGHWGSRKTLQMLQRKYIFNDMKEHVDHHVKTCNVCQRVKFESKRTKRRIQF